MSIVCGTDFSEWSTRGARVAAAMARALKDELVLVHVAERADEEAERLLRSMAGQLGAQARVETRPVWEPGHADEGLVEVARRERAQLVVVAALGARRQERWALGSVAERVAQLAPVPTLVVRNAERLEAWAQGDDSPLRVVVGVEPTPGSLAALAWARTLMSVGPVELVLAHMVWPPEAHQRLGVPPPVPLDGLRPEIEAGVRRELETWAAGAELPERPLFVVQAGYGRVDAHLARLASDEHAELVVLGTHQRAGVARLWQGSVSRGVLHTAAMSVVCVPRPPEPTRG